MNLKTERRLKSWNEIVRMPEKNERITEWQWGWMSDQLARQMNERAECNS